MAMQVTWGYQSSDEALVALRGSSEQDATPDCVFAFVSGHTDLEVLGPLLATFGGPVVACTTAGQLGRSGFEHGGLTTAIVQGGLKVQSFLVRSLGDLAASLDELVVAVHASGVLAHGHELTVFGLVLVDGLSGVEERLMEGLSLRLPSVPMIGGSAGDDLEFRSTRVYWQGQFLEDVAVVHLFTTAHPVTQFKFQHHIPTDRRLVITRATPERRMVHEINGVPAVEAYAEAIGVPVASLTEPLMAEFPLMIRIAGELFSRSVHHVEPDGSLHFYCAIDVGLVLRLGQTHDIVGTAKAAFATARARAGEPALVIGCDCVLRRLEIERLGYTEEISQVLADNRVVGFSCYGEQFNSMHATQIFAGVMIGVRPA